MLPTKKLPLDHVNSCLPCLFAQGVPEDRRPKIIVAAVSRVQRWFDDQSPVKQFLLSSLWRMFIMGLFPAVWACVTFYIVTGNGELL